MAGELVAQVIEQLERHRGIKLGNARHVAVHFGRIGERKQVRAMIGIQRDPRQAGQPHVVERRRAGQVAVRPARTEMEREDRAGRLVAGRRERADLDRLPVRVALDERRVVRFEHLARRIDERQRDPGGVASQPLGLDAGRDDVAEERAERNRRARGHAAAAVEIDAEHVVRSVGFIRDNADLDEFRQSGPALAPPVVGPAVIVLVRGRLEVAAIDFPSGNGPFLGGRLLRLFGGWCRGQKQ